MPEWKKTEGMISECLIYDHQDYFLYMQVQVGDIEVIEWHIGEHTDLTISESTGLLFQWDESVPHNVFQMTTAVLSADECQFAGDMADKLGKVCMYVVCYGGLVIVMCYYSGTISMGKYLRISQVLLKQQNNDTSLYISLHATSIKFLRPCFIAYISWYGSFCSSTTHISSFYSVLSRVVLCSVICVIHDIVIYR